MTDQPWTDDDLDAEYAHALETRLAILCGKEKPTPEQKEIAKREALELLKKLQIKTP